jgi:hypothetical protein
MQMTQVPPQTKKKPILPPFFFLIQRRQRSSPQFICLQDSKLYAFRPTLTNSSRIQKISSVAQHSKKGPYTSRSTAPTHSHLDDTRRDFWYVAVRGLQVRGCAWTGSALRGLIIHSVWVAPSCSTAPALYGGLWALKLHMIRSECCSGPGLLLLEGQKLSCMMVHGAARGNPSAHLQTRPYPRRCGAHCILIQVSNNLRGVQGSWHSTQDVSPRDPQPNIFCFAQRARVGASSGGP